MLRRKQELNNQYFNGFTSHDKKKKSFKKDGGWINA
jgi:hypothetical protein